MPLSDPALTVTAAVPEEVSVTDPVPVPPTATVPRLTLVVLSESVGTAAHRLIPLVAVPPPAVAVSIAVCAALTADTVAVKLALLDPATTIADDGTATEVLLLDRFTAWPPVPAGLDTVTWQLSVPAPVIAPGEQLSALTFTGPLSV